MAENTIKRIKQFIDYKGVTVSLFEKEVGMSNGSFASQLKNDRTIGVDKLENILKKYPDINPEWLLTGKGDMVKEEGSISSKKNTANKDNNKPKGIPMLPFDAFAGVGSQLLDGYNFDAIEERYDVPLFKGVHIDFMVPVKGSSMYPKYASGDVVACRMVKELLYIQWNKTYVIDTITNGTIIKRLKKGSKEGYIVCKSDNESYDPFEIPISDIRNIALVVGVIRLE